MEEEEEAHTAVYEATETATDEVEAEYTTTMVRAALLREYCATILVPACLTMARNWQQTKQDHHGRKSCNTLALNTDKTLAMNDKKN